jgi:Leucine-rich repeat (LRR) protein
MIDVLYNNGMTKNFNNLNEIFDNNQLNIIKIDCSNNQLKEIPVEIGHLINLQEFYCSNNQLKEISELEEFSLENKVFLPKEIGNLINLRAFDCSSNQLKELPVKISNLISLEVLCCADNKFSKLPIEICNLTNLQYFNCSKNKINNFDVIHQLKCDKKLSNQQIEILEYNYNQRPNKINNLII